MDDRGVRHVAQIDLRPSLIEPGIESLIDSH
jgi:hypothetical protein